MSKVLDQLERIRKRAKRDFAVPEAGIVVPLPQKITKFVEEIRKEISTRDDFKPREINLEAIAKKAVARARGTKVDYTAKEARYLPLALEFLPGDKYIVDKTLQDIDLQKLRMLRKTVYTYFNLYRFPSNYLVTRLRQLILNVLEKNPEWNEQITYLDFPHHGTRFLEKDGAQELGKCLGNGILSYLADVGFPETLKDSWFVQSAIQSFFYSAYNSGNIVEIKTAFQEIRNLEMYSGVISERIPFYDDNTSIADIMIETAARPKEQELRRQLLKYLTRLMGDPRDPVKKPQWGHVSRKNQQIFISWIIENHLALFFTIISKVTIDFDSRRRWKYREAFWSDFIKEMVNTRVILNGWAIEEVKANPNLELVGYGRLSGGGYSKCLLMFSIGDYVFIEPSDMGKLRIFYLESPIPFYEESGKVNIYSWNSVIHSDKVVREISHHGSEQFYWQHEAYDFMRENCGVGYKDEKNWRPKQ